MTTELQPAPLRVIDREQMRKDFETIEARQAELTRSGQKLMARIRPTSKYHGQVTEDELFAICIGPAAGYCVVGGPGGQYRLSDVDLFAVFDDTKPPIQITFSA